MTLPKLPWPHVQLLLALILQMVMLVLGAPGLLKDPANVLFTLWIALATFSITGLRKVFWATLVLGATPAVLNLLFPYEQSPLALNVLKDALWAIFPLYVAVRILIQMFRVDDITVEEIAGAVALYVLLGMAFGDVFELVDLLVPGSIAFANLPAGTAASYADYLYFSFVTLTTTGYGDVAPVGHLARAMAMLEALMGLMYISILVARVVSLHAGKAPEER